MQEEYNIPELNPRKNPYVDRLETIIDEAILAVDSNFGMPNAKQMAEYLANHNVVIANERIPTFVEPAVGDTVIKLPVPVGTTFYRIDNHSKACSYHHEHRENNLYYCVNDWKCKHLCDGLCDAGREYKVFTIRNASAQVILSNASLFGTNKLFLDEKDANREAARLNAEEVELRKKRGLELPSYYEGYRENWEDECEDDED